MSKDNLLEKISLSRFTGALISINGTLRVTDLPRLCPSLASTNGVVNVQVTFGIDDQGIRFLNSRVETSLILQCQRCMESFDYAIMTDSQFGVVTAESETEQLPSTYEPVIAEEDFPNLKDLV